MSKYRFYIYPDKVARLWIGYIDESTDRGWKEVKHTRCYFSSREELLESLRKELKVIRELEEHTEEYIYV